MICLRCGHTLSDSDNFCARCGKDPKKKTPYSEFELGRIAAFDTVRSDFWRWFLTGFALLTILALFGVNEIIKDKVSDAISNHLQRIQKTTEDASAKALQAGAEADIETKKVDVTLTALAAKQVELQGSLDETDKKKKELETSIDELGREKQKMVSATTELQQKEDALNRIIKTENLATTFAELRNDHYRVRTLKARVLYELVEAPPLGTIQFTLNTISLSKVLPNKNPSETQTVVQFQQSAQPVILNSSNGAPIGAFVTYEMYPVFDQLIVSHSITNLDGVTVLTLQFGPVQPNPPATIDTTLENLKELVKLTKKLTVEIELNGTILNHFEFNKDNLNLPADASSLVSNGTVTFNVTKDLGGSFKDVKTLFDTLTSAQ